MLNLIDQSFVDFVFFVVENASNWTRASAFAGLRRDRKAPRYFEVITYLLAKIVFGAWTAGALSLTSTGPSENPKNL